MGTAPGAGLSGHGSTWEDEFGGVIPTGTNLEPEDVFKARKTVAVMCTRYVRGYGGLRTPPGMVRRAQGVACDDILEALDLPPRRRVER